MGKSSSLQRAISGRLRLARLAFQDHPAYCVIRDVARQGLTYLGAAALMDLYESVREIEARGVSGVLVEAGSARGGSAIVMAHAKKPDRLLYLYDVFGMIPPPSTRDQGDAHLRYAQIVSGAARGIGDATYYGYEEGLIDKVATSFDAFDLPLATNHVTLVQGLYEESLHIDRPVALAHIDCDWYDSVMVCLERITPWLAPGGRLVIDDYQEWAGCKQAVDDYFAERAADFTFEMKSRLHITRRPDVTS